MTPTAAEASLERLLEYLRESRGFDFTAYKRASLARRIRRRMDQVGAPGLDAYLELLKAKPAEFAELFNTILINVTGFFRDAEVWDALRETVLPELLALRSSDEPIRIWSAGCASGQEPYSVVMMLAEAMGAAAARERVKIYATDVDEETLAQARRAVFTSKELAGVPDALVARYFEPLPSGGVFHRELRRCVIFGRHDLLQDPPISRIDLLLCRNTLMYFTAEAQSRIMGHLSFSVNPAGYLVLGRAEMLFRYTGLFKPVDLKHRIFKGVPKVRHRDRAARALSAEPKDNMSSKPAPARLTDTAFDGGADADIILDPEGNLAAANDVARRLFHLSDSAVGTPVQDLELSYRPVELRQSLDDVRRERRPAVLRNVPWTSNGQPRHVDVILTPLLEGATLVGVRITFSDVSLLKRLQDELTQSRQEVETAYEELQSTNEELETTNEELQSTVEELETTNEELQSTNEELETMNEELQSTNEELQTMNDELRNRSSDVTASNTFLESVFNSVGSVVVVLDRDLRVDVWNAGAADMWGLRSDEARQANFFNLDFGLPVAELHQPIRDAIHDPASTKEVTIAATNRKGRRIDCRVRISPLRQPDGTTTGVILLMQDATAASPGV